jgi:hypothetical protein
MNKLLTMAFAAALITACAAPVSNERNEKIVFVTKASFQSDMGGLSGADTKCQKEADDPASIVPAGTYLPWLSDGTDSPDTRFTKSSHPYVLPDGTKIAENYADLTDGSILNAINVNATGAPVLGAQRFWTDTTTDGKAAHDCNYRGHLQKNRRVDQLPSVMVRFSGATKTIDLFPAIRGCG